MLKRLEIQAKLEEARAAANDHRSEGAAFETRRAQLTERRDALTVRVDAVNEETPEKERLDVEAETKAIEAEDAAIETEETAFASEQARLDAAVTELEGELAEIDARAQRGANPTSTKNTTERKETYMPNIKKRTLFPDYETRARFFEQDNVKNWVEDIRDKCKRGVKNGKVLIPVEVLDVIRPAIETMSKLYRHVRVRRLSGTARQPILGEVPEAVWTEACGTLNELGIDFADCTLDAYKVGGWIPVCNTLLEDSVINLGEEIMRCLAASIAKALDKAIIYGTGVKMPLGIVTRLAQESDPSDTGTTVPWVDYHTSNIITIANTYTGKELYQQLVLASGAAEATNVLEPMFAAMNRKTWVWLKAQAATFDAAGALRADLDGILPIIGAEIEIINDVPDYNIIMGYGEKYPLGERREVVVDFSEHVMFIQDHTVFRAKALYDGRPAIAQAFVLVGVNGTAPTTSKTFRPDYANAAMNTLVVSAAAAGTAGKTVLTVSGALNTTSPTYKYQIGEVMPGVGTVPAGTWTELTSGTTAIEAAAGVQITVVELDTNGLVVSRGVATSIPKAS